MRTLTIRLTLIISICVIQPSLSQVDPTKATLVYQHQDMEKVTVQNGLTYKTINDTTLTYDVYYPPGFNKKSNLPLVIFNNGVGGNELPTWRVYKDWAKLAATN